MNTTLECIIGSCDELDMSDISVNINLDEILNVSCQLDTLAFQMKPQNRTAPIESQWDVQEIIFAEESVDTDDEFSLGDSLSLFQEDPHIFECDESIIMNEELICAKQQKEYSNINLSSISQKRMAVYDFLWSIVPNNTERNHFLFLCETYIPKNEDAKHYNFWNLAASCLYCVCLQASVPVVIEEIIESDQRITRNRMTRIGKTIRIKEKAPKSIPDLMAVRMVCRMAKMEYRTSIGQSISENAVLENLSQINEDKNMIGVSLYHRLIVIYSLFVPTIKGNAICSDDISKACIFFRQPCTMWLLKVCQVYQKKHNNKI